MSIRCTVAVIQKTNQVSHHQSMEDGKLVPNKPTCSVTLAALPDPANLRWARYMPRVELTIDSTEAYDAFTLGDVYIVDFTAAAAPA